MKRPIKPQMSQYSTYFRLSPAERFDRVQQGVSAEILLKAAEDMELNEKQLRKILHLRSFSLEAKASTHQVLYRQEASRVVGLLRLIGQVDAMVAESGDSQDFIAAKWLAMWINAPNPALGGKLPTQFMHLSEGLELLSELLAQAQSGVYA